MMQSKELTAFYDDWLKWVDDGALYDRNFIFQRRDGLCCALMGYARKTIPSISDRYAVYGEMNTQFLAAGLNESFPFNADQNSDCEYFDEKDKTTNPRRVAWVRARASKAEEGGKHCPWSGDLSSYGGSA